MSDWLTLLSLGGGFAAALVLLDGVGSANRAAKSMLEQYSALLRESRRAGRSPPGAPETSGADESPDSNS